MCQSIIKKIKYFIGLQRIYRYLSLDSSQNWSDNKRKIDIFVNKYILKNQILMGKIQLKRLEIVCDKSEKVYRPGDVITGYCAIQLDGKLDLNQLVIKLRGCAEVRWAESVEFESHIVSCYANHQLIRQSYFPDSCKRFLINILNLKNRKIFKIK